MSEERIDIQVTDKVDPGVAKKMEAIAAAADRGYTHLERLKQALANINTTAVDKLAAAMAKADSAAARLISAQARLTNAQSSGSVAAQKAALAQQRVATEAARTQAAQQRATAATSAAQAAALRLQAAQQRLAGASQQASNAQQQATATTQQARSGFGGAAAAVSAYVRQLLGMKSASGQAVAANQAVANSMNTVVNATQNSNRVARRTAAVNANIIAQINDIGVSLAGGQNPLLVMIQQGSQLSYIAGQMDGGFKALLGTIARLLLPFAALAAVVATLYIQFRAFNNSVAKESKPELEAYAKTLGLTDKEMRKLSNTTVTASGKLKSFDNVTVTMGDSWRGFIKTVQESLEWLTPYWDATTKWISNAWDKTMGFLGEAIKITYAVIVGTFKSIGALWDNLPQVAGNAAKGIANEVIGAVEWLLNATNSGINTLIGAVNPLLERFGIQMGTVAKVSFGRFAIEGKTASEIVGSSVAEAYKDIDSASSSFMKRWRANTIQAAKDRLKTMADAIIANRNPGTDNSAEKAAINRAHALAMVNLQLDNELARMKLLKDERAIQQRMDQIEQQLAQKKITLNEQERASIQAKVTAIENYKYVQSEMDRIFESAVAPVRTYNAALEASTDLFSRGKLTLEQYNAELNKASDVYKGATDPLFQFNRELDSASALLGKYGTALQDAIYLEQIRQEYQSRGLSIYDASTGKLRNEVAAILAKNAALREQQFIQSQVSSVLDPILEQSREVTTANAVYAELERLRQEDLIKEDQYAQAKAALWVKLNEGRVGAVSDMFGALASVTAKGEGAIGAISKAAAIAQATMDGYVAAQKALASLPPPFNFAAAAAVAIKTGMNIAGIVSTNAGSFATGGQFMVQGRSGVDANNINMNVTRGERVTVETPKQQRQNDSQSAGAAPSVNVPVRVVAQFDPRMALDAVDTAEGERVVLSIIERNPQVMQRLMGSR